MAHFYRVWPHLLRAFPQFKNRVGYPASARLLVIHADDFGMSHSVNRATADALEQGWVTSASILVPCPWLPEVARFAKAHPEADLGIHLALSSEWTDFRWGPVSSRDNVPSLLDAQGYLPLDTPEVGKNAKRAEVEAEFRAQIERAHALGINPTHLDAHMLTALSTTDLLRIYLRMGPAYGPTVAGQTIERTNFRLIGASRFSAGRPRHSNGTGDRCAALARLVQEVAGRAKTRRVPTHRASGLRR
jgi:hypothetical protein